MKNTKGILPWIAAIFVVAVWGETFISSKVLLNAGLSPADIFFYRFFLAYIFLWAFSHKRLLAASFKDEFLTFILGIFGGSLYFLAENSALKYSTASNVAILVGSAPLVTALLVAVFNRSERMNGRQLTGSAVVHWRDCCVDYDAWCWRYFRRSLRGASVDSRGTSSAAKRTCRGGRVS